ncbi:ras-associating and dilute domain-containing protein isoform X2 [Protopterus annectens]|nr:ras-associating and dilute domain-containing protein isoform X2 [Protopterus annectens]
MFYGSSVSMSPPSTSKLKRQSKIFTQALYRTLSYRDRRSVAEFPFPVTDDPAELSIQLSAPGVLKIFGGEICRGAHYKSVLATSKSSAKELVKEALERYSLSKAFASEYVLCDVIGRFEGANKHWRMEGLRSLGDNEKPLLIQDLWKPKEGYARRFELRKRSDVEQMAAREKDTITACINAQARKLQRHRARVTMTLPSDHNLNPGATSLRRSLSETSLHQAGTQNEEIKRYCSTLPGPIINVNMDAREHKKQEEKENSIRQSLHQFPHLLLLQGYSQQNDNLVYILNRDHFALGKETLSAKPNIVLSAPDILPLHCKIRRIKQFNRSGKRAEEKMVLEPVAGASVLINFREVRKPCQLHHRDLLSVGLYYIFLYKDPSNAKPLSIQTLLNLKVMNAPPEEVGSICRKCGSLLKERPTAHRMHRISKYNRSSQRRKVQLEYESSFEDMLLDRIMSLIEPGGDDFKLTPAFLFCLCIQHSASAFSPGNFSQLLLKIAKRIQSAAWEKTRELAEKQSFQQDSTSLSLLTITDLVPDLQHILFWMSNSIELLYFIQQKTPGYIQSMEEELDMRGSKESLISSTITANEEAMNILEEVIMYTFQQCVYYITKTLYVALPNLLKSTPFLSENVDSRQSTSPFPDVVQKVVLIYQTATELLHHFEVHTEVATQMFAYLFFFSNASLFNQLMDKGPGWGCFQWPRGAHIQGSLQLLLDWTRTVDLGHMADEFFTRLSTAVRLLALPASQLTQMNWQSLRSEFPALNPAQLHHSLTQYQLATSTGPIPFWQPDTKDMPAASRTEEILEHFDNHPPIVLPTGNFKVDLEEDPLNDNVYRHLLYIRHFLWSLRSKISTNGYQNNGEHQISLDKAKVQMENHAAFSGHRNATDRPKNNHTDMQVDAAMDGRASVSSSTSGSTKNSHPNEEKVKGKVQRLHHQSTLGRNGHPRQNTQAVGTSCLLTPPNTPLNIDMGHTGTTYNNSCRKDLTNGHNDGFSTKKSKRTESNQGNVTVPYDFPTPVYSGRYDFPTPVSSGRSSATDDFCFVFVTEIEKGPYGLGMGLIDGLHTPLNSPGIYVRTLIPDSPAATDGKLSIGDRILAVNGTSLIGADYQGAVDLIRLGGKKLRFLVAKSDVEIVEKISASSC